MKVKTIIVALGGNAILQAGQNGTIEEQLHNVDTACRHLTEIMSSREYRFVITHGNGPQVGNVLLQNEMASKLIPPMPLDVCVAATQGMIGYIIQQTLANHLRAAGLPHRITTILTQTIVSKDDPAYLKPTKPIGSFYLPQEAEQLKENKGWDMINDNGKGYRRVVPSPLPVEIQESRIISNMLNSGEIVIAVGGGGIPVIRHSDRSLHGTEVVIDKDLAAAKLAISLSAELLMILTDVEQVMLGYDGIKGFGIARMTIEEAEKYILEGEFAKGSMLPKVQACVNFVKAGGEKAIITCLNKAKEALEEKTGTIIFADKR